MDICPVGSDLMSFCPTGGRGRGLGDFPLAWYQLVLLPPAPIYIQIEIQIDLFSLFETRGFTFPVMNYD